MEYRLQQGLQAPPYDLLGNAVCDRRYAQRARAATRLRNVHPTNRWREVAPGRQPIPQLVRLLARFASNAAIDCPSTPAAPWLAFTLLKASQTSRFEISNGFAPTKRLLPSPVGCMSWQDTAAPSLQPHYRAFDTTTDSSAPVLRISASILAGASRLDLLLAALHATLAAIATTGSHVPSKSLFWVHATFQPDAAEAGLQGSASAYPGTTTNPGSDIIDTISAFHRRFAFARLPRPHHSRIIVLPILQRSPPALLTPAACSGLHPAPDRRMRGALPHLLLSSTPPSQSVCSWHTVVAMLGVTQHLVERNPVKACPQIGYLAPSHVRTSSATGC
jgi:hypothetical protein